MTFEDKKNSQNSPGFVGGISPIPTSLTGNTQSDLKLLNENIHQDDEEKTMSFNPDTQMNEDVENGNIDHDQTMILQDDNNQDFNAISAIEESGDIIANGISESFAVDQTAHGADSQISGISIENSGVSDPHQSAFAAPVVAPASVETLESPRDPLLIKEQFKWVSRTIASFKKRRTESYIFLMPVDPVVLQIPTYFSIVKHPMDVSTIEKKLSTHQYTLADEFISDFELMFQNCFTFNGEDPVANPIVQLAINCKNWFHKELAKMPKTYEEALALTQKKRPGRPSDIGPRSSLPTRSTSEIVESSGKRRLAAVSSAKKSGPEMKFCQYIHREAFKKANYEFTWPFQVPVDHVGLGIPTYPQIIKHPMDLSTMRKKLENNEYVSADDYEADFRLMLDNCFKFNAAGSDIHKLGKRFEHWFFIKWGERNSFLNQHGETRPKTSQTFSEADDTDDEAYNSQMSILRQQLQLTQKMIDDLVESKRKEKERRRVASASAYSSVSANTAAAASALSYHSPAQHAGSFASKAQAKPKKPSKPRGRKKRPHASSDDERMPETDITYEQKRELSDNINILPPDKLPQVFEIIKENANLGGVNEEEIELDIDSLEKSVLWKLYLFVKKHTRPPKKAKYDEQGVEVDAVGADASSSSEAESDDSDAAFMVGPDEVVAQTESTLIGRPSVGGKKQSRKSRGGTSGTSIQAITATTTTSVSQVITNSSRKGKPATSFSPLPFRTEKGDTTSYTSNFITSSKTTVMTSSTPTATSLYKPKPSAPVKSYVSVLDLAFQIDKGKDKPIDNVPEAPPKNLVGTSEPQPVILATRQPEVSSNTTLEPPPRSPSPESEYVDPSEWLDLQGPADAIQTFMVEVLDGVDEIPQQIIDMRANLFGKMKKEVGMMGPDGLITNETGYNLDYGNEDSEEDGAL